MMKGGEAQQLVVFASLFQYYHLFFCIRLIISQNGHTHFERFLLFLLLMYSSLSPSELVHERAYLEKQWDAWVDQIIAQSSSVRS